MTDDDHELELRSYGRRRGRKPSAHQESLLRDLLPRVSVDLTSPSHPGKRVGVRGLQTTSVCPPRELHTHPPLRGTFSPSGEGSQSWLEIGFGGGEHLLWQARANPGVGFIGCEPFEDGVMKVLAAIDSEGLENIRVHMGDARDVLRALPEASISRTFILFPDPWPKRKHQKRRLINPHVLDMLARVIQPSGELRFATDIGDYARSALLAFRTEPRFKWTARSPQDWRIRPDDWPQTRYEAKAIREGRRRYFFRFVRGMNSLSPSAPTRLAGGSGPA